MRKIKRMVGWASIGHKPVREEEADTKAVEETLAKYIAVAASVAGLDLKEKDEDLDLLMSALKKLVTSDKAKLKSRLARWTKSKARQAVTVARGSA
jgi:hypothetical protein